MDNSLISAMAAVLGSLVGGSATIVTAWITQRTSTKRELISEELRKRETLYGEFISECSKLAIDALAHGIEKPEKLWSAYALLNRIRLSASAAVLAEAEAVLKRIAEQYFSPTFRSTSSAPLRCRKRAIHSSRWARRAGSNSRLFARRGSAHGHQCATASGCARPPECASAFIPHGRRSCCSPRG